MSLLAFTQKPNFLMQHNDEENLNKILEEKFMTSSKFSMEIENLVKQNNGDLNYIDAVVLYCTENNIEIDTVSKLISKALKEKIKYDAQKLNYIKRSSNAKLFV
mgnify:CR=1 FL=1